MVQYDFGKEAEETDKELADELNKLKGLSEDEIKDLLPKRADQAQLKELIEAVNNAKDLNKKKAVLLNRLAIVAPAVKEVIKSFVKIAV